METFKFFFEINKPATYKRFEYNNMKTANNVFFIQLQNYKINNQTLCKYVVRDESA